MLGLSLDLGRGHVMCWCPVLGEGSPQPSLSCAPPPALLCRGMFSHLHVRGLVPREVKEAGRPRGSLPLLTVEG